MEPPAPTGARSPPDPPLGAAAAVFGAPAAPAGETHPEQEWLKHPAPPGQIPQSTVIPQVVPEPHCQSTPHFEGTQQKPM